MSVPLQCSLWRCRLLLVSLLLSELFASGYEGLQTAWRWREDPPCHCKLLHVLPVLLGRLQIPFGLHRCLHRRGTHRCFKRMAWRPDPFHPACSLCLFPSQYLSFSVYHTRGQIYRARGLVPRAHYLGGTSISLM